jgi:hypothetical protein
MISLLRSNRQFDSTIWTSPGGPLFTAPAAQPLRRTGRAPKSATVSAGGCGHRGVRLPSGSLPTFAARVRAQLSTVPPHVARQLAMVEALTHAITAAERDLARQAKADPTCRRLMTAPGGGSQHGAAVRRGPRRDRPVPDVPRGRGVLGPRPGRALELGEAAADWHHEGRLTGVASHARPGGLGCATLPTHGPAATLGPRGAEAAGQARRRGCPGPQAGGPPGRALARRDHLRTELRPATTQRPSATTRLRASVVHRR